MRASGRTRSKVISTLASQLRRIPAWRRRCSSIWLGRAGGYIGTGTAPANRMPKKQRKKSSPEGSISATQSPGRTPSATSAPAKRVATSCSWPQLSVSACASSTRKRTWMRPGWRATCHSRTSTRVAADSGSAGGAPCRLSVRGGGGWRRAAWAAPSQSAPRWRWRGRARACAIARSRSRGVSAPASTSVGRRRAKRRSMRASSSTRLRLSRPSSRSSALSRLARRVVPGCSSLNDLVDQAQQRVGVGRSGRGQEGCRHRGEVRCARRRAARRPGRGGRVAQRTAPAGGSLGNIAAHVNLP